MPDVAGIYAQRNRRIEMERMVERPEISEEIIRWLEDWWFGNDKEEEEEEEECQEK